MAAVGPAYPGDRARILYDQTDWYMGTVVAVHRGLSVTVRFDDGSAERVTLCPGDAELCADDAYGAPSCSALTTPSAGSEGTCSGRDSSSSNSRPRTRSSSTRECDKKDARVFGLGFGGHKLGNEEGLVLTEARARALLDTVPGKLRGLMYQEQIRGYGWWKTLVTEVSKERVGRHPGAEPERDEIDTRWPKEVKVEQIDPTGRSEGWFPAQRKVGELLAHARAWDRQREVLEAEKKPLKAEATNKVRQQTFYMY